jgi:hypothetical protein
MEPWSAIVHSELPRQKGNPTRCFLSVQWHAQSSIFAFHRSTDVSCSVRGVGLRQPFYRLALLNLLEKRDGRDLNHSQERRPGVYSEHITHALANAAWTFTNGNALCDVKCVRYECME